MTLLATAPTIAAAPAPAAATPPLPARAAELAVIVPVFNERANVAELVARLEQVLAGVAWEVVFVDDDSPDETAAEVRRLGRSKPHVRCVQRIGRRGLASACVEGMLATSADYLAVMDGDLQHDESLLPAMLAELRSGALDVVVASRHVPGGGLGDWAASRVAISDFATRLSRLVLKSDLTDPMSGFFMITRPAFEASMRNLSAIGFKILVDLFASAPRPLRFKELPFVFRTRQAGESKLDSLVALEFLILLLDKLFGRFVPVRFLLFGLIGGSGVVVHLSVLGLASQVVGAPFMAAQTLATFVAMTSNFFLNNWLTYRDRRLKGWRVLWGLASFYLVCSLGVVANVGIANFAFERDWTWWFSGLVGAVVGAVWNYATSSVITWRGKR
jgi:dolichol-phosphate mannosyltransferase